MLLTVMFVAMPLSPPTPIVAMPHAMMPFQAGS